MNNSNKKRSNETKKNCITTKPGPKLEKINVLSDTIECSKQNHCSLIAKDSEWVDILEGTSNCSNSSDDSNTPSGEQLIIQPENDPEIEPFTLMFPNLLNEDPETLEGIVNKALSTTEVTKHLIGHKADFSFLKKVNRLIPRDKKWMDRVSENSSSYESSESLMTNINSLPSCSTGRTEKSLDTIQYLKKTK